MRFHFTFCRGITRMGMKPSEVNKSRQKIITSGATIPEMIFPDVQLAPQAVMARTRRRMNRKDGLLVSVTLGNHTCGAEGLSISRTLCPQRRRAVTLSIRLGRVNRSQLIGNIRQVSKRKDRSFRLMPRQGLTAVHVSGKPEGFHYRLLYLRSTVGAGEDIFVGRPYLKELIEGF